MGSADDPLKIKFSRHAQRRSKLYGISRSDIISVLSTMNLHQGVQEVTKDVMGLLYPLKIVAIAESEDVTIVTAIP